LAGLAAVLRLSVLSSSMVPNPMPPALELTGALR
jgi:hypothetical protein